VNTLGPNNTDTEGGEGLSPKRRRDYWIRSELRRRKQTSGEVATEFRSRKRCRRTGGGKDQMVWDRTGGILIGLPRNEVDAAAIGHRISFGSEGGKPLRRLGAEKDRAGVLDIRFKTDLTNRKRKGAMTFSDQRRRRLTSSA